MALDFIEGKIDSIRAEADNLRDEYLRTQAEVASDPALTDTGKREALAPAHATLSEMLKNLRQQERDVVRIKREKLERDVFGLPAGAANNPAQLVSFRDAQDRANRLTDRDEAEQAYKSALRSDDTVLAQAILAQAIQRGWSNVTDDYCTRNPSARTDLDDLRKIGQYEQNSLSITAQYMVPALSTARPVTVPIAARDELQGASGSGQHERPW